MEIPATLPNADNNDLPCVDNLELVDGNIGTVPRITQRQAAIRSRASTRQLALEDQQDPDLVEEIRNFSQIYTPVVSRDNSLDRLENSIHLQDSPPDFSYEAEHTTVFGGGNPTYLGSLYDVSLGSSLLMALTPSPTSLESSPILEPPCNQDPPSPVPSNESRMSSSPDFGCSFKFPTRIFYRSRKCNRVHSTSGAQE